MPDRKPLKWPGRKRLALTITFNLEYWDLTQDHDGLYIPGGPSLNDRLRILPYSAEAGISVPGILASGGRKDARPHSLLRVWA